MFAFLSRLWATIKAACTPPKIEPASIEYVFVPIASSVFTSALLWLTGAGFWTSIVLTFAVAVLINTDPHTDEVKASSKWRIDVFDRFLSMVLP